MTAIANIDHHDKQPQTGQLVPPGLKHRQVRQVPDIGGQGPTQVVLAQLETAANGQEGQLTNLGTEDIPDTETFKLCTNRMSIDTTPSHLPASTQHIPAHLRLFKEVSERGSCNQINDRSCGETHLTPYSHSQG